MRAYWLTTTALVAGLFTATGSLAQDVPGDTSSTASVDGMPINGAIETPGDEDWFSFQVTGDDEGGVEISLRGLASGGGTLVDPFLRIYDAAGNPIAENDDAGGPDSRLVFVAPEPGTYYASAGAFGVATGSYTLTLAPAGGAILAEAPQADPMPGPDGMQTFFETTAENYGEYDAAANISTQSSMTLDSTFVGELEASGGDEDWIAIELQAGQELRVQVFGFDTGLGTLDDPLFNFYGPGGEYLGLYDDAITLEPDAVLRAVESGTHYIAVGGYGGGAGTYNVQVNSDTSGFEDPFASGGFGFDEGFGTGYAGGGDAVGDTPETAGMLEMGQRTAGLIDVGGDRDFFAVMLDAGESISVSLQGSGSGVGTLSDAYLNLLDSNGNTLASNDDGGEGFDSLLSFVAPSAGVYYISAEGLGSSDTGTYLLSLQDGDQNLIQDAVPGNSSTQETLNPGGIAVGVIDAAGDEDWYRVELVAGQTYRIQVSGSSSGSGTLVDPFLQLYAANGTTLLAQNDDDLEDVSTLDSGLTFTAPQSGVAFIAASGLSEFDTGTFIVSFELQ